MTQAAPLACNRSHRTLWGALSDRIGRKPVLLLSVLGSAAAQFPLQWFLQDTAWQLFLALLIAMVPLAAGVSILPAVYAEMFPTGIRSSGMALPYSLTVALFGGTAPYFQGWTSAHLGRSVFDGYVVVVLLITAATVLTLPETRGTPWTRLPLMRLLDYVAEHRIRVVDLSQPLFSGAPSSPSHPSFRSALTLRHGDSVRPDGMTGAHEMFTSGGHVGTHVDALCHVAIDGKIYGDRAVEVVDGRYSPGGIEEFPLAVRRAVLVDVPALRGVDRLASADPVTADDLDMVEAAIGSGDAVLVRTGWAQPWPNEQAYLGRDTGVPVLDPSAGAWLARRQVSVVGADTIALEQITPDVGHSRLPVHRILLAEHGTHLIEVMNLEPICDHTEFAFVCAPLNILGATGSPARPLALLDSPPEMGAL